MGSVPNWFERLKAESWTKERKEWVMLSLFVCLLPGRRANGQRWW